MADIAIEEPELELPAGDEELPVDETEVEAEPPEGEEDEDEVLVIFEGEGGAPPPSEEHETPLARHLRTQIRERDRKIRALEARQAAPVPARIEVGEEPTLASAEYDEDAFKTQWRAWNDRKAQAERQEAEANRVQQQQQEAWNSRVSEVSKQFADLKAKDLPQALEEVQSAFNETQQAVLTWAPKNSAAVTLYLGRNPAKAAELAKISNPIALAGELGRLEGKLTVTNKRNAPPPPEQIVRGSAPLSAPADKQLERLEAEAARTGDRTKVVQYKRQLKAKGR